MGMDQILVVVITKFGVLMYKAVKCDDKTVCSVLLDIDNDMSPHFTVEIYHVKDKNVFEQGSIKIETENLAMNSVS